MVHKTQTVVPSNSEFKIQTWNDVLLLVLEIFVLAGKICFAILEAVFRLVVPVPLKSVEGEIVLITGTGHGIGKELALQYAALNALVVCLDVNEQQNKETVAQINNSGKTAYGYKCDITNRNEIFETVSKIQKDIGDITILVNNAGILISHSFLEHTKEELEKTINTNVMAHFWTLQAVLPTMIKNSYGHIVALSSCAGLVSMGNIVAYGASKFAVRGMMIGLKDEIRAIPNCKVNFTTVYPFLISTGLAKTLKMRFALHKDISPTTAAKEIIAAQRRNKQDVSIPRYMLTSILISHLFPSKINELVKEFLGYKFESDI